MGIPTSKARTSFTGRFPGASAPALFGVAAALALTNAPAFASTQASVHHAATQIAVHHLGATATWPRSATTRSAGEQESPRPVSYTIKSGDTLSAIAERFYQDPGYWPVLYWANQSKIQYANEIQAGQVVTVPVKPATIPRPPAVLAPASTTALAGNESSAPVYAAQAVPAAATPAQSAQVSTAGYGSFQSCVIARESGGNSQVMNSSGHYGLYQFSASTWAAYGGNPGDFGNASVAEQNQVFNAAIAAGGASNWSAYDGC